MANYGNRKCTGGCFILQEGSACSCVVLGNFLQLIGRRFGKGGILTCLKCLIGFSFSMKKGLQVSKKVRSGNLFDGR